MKSLLNTVLKLLGVFVLAAVAVGVVLIAIGLFSWGHYEAAQTAGQAQKNAAIDVLRMYASPPNPTLAWRFYLVENTCPKAIAALKFRVTVFNKLKQPIDCTVVSTTQPIAPHAEVYCDAFTLFDADTGIPTESRCYVDRTDKRLGDFAVHEAGCTPDDLRVNRPFKVKVLAIAYGSGS